MIKLPVLCLVLPCYNEDKILDYTYSELHMLYSRLIGTVISEESRILFVDDGSTDTTWERIVKFHGRDKCFEGLRLSKNKGHQTALYAGIEYAVGRADVIISLDADLQQDIETISELLGMYAGGYDIVNAVRNDRKTDGWFKKVTALAYYKLMRAMGCNLIENSADFRMLSKRAAKALTEYQESNLFLRGLIPELGFKAGIVSFDVKERLAGESKYSLKKMITLAVDGITSFSIFPIRIIFCLGVFVLLLSVVMVMYALIANILGNTVSGWTSLSASLWFLGGVELIGIGTVGEYIGRTYIEAKRRPRYFIDERCVGGLGDSDGAEKQQRIGG